MRILHASHTHLKSLGARNYFLPVRINNGFIRNGHEVYWFSDRDVARYSAPFNSRRFGVGAANRKFLRVCQNFQPDVIALCSQDIIRPATLAAARRLLPHVAIFQYYIDPLFYDLNLQAARAKADVVDWSFVTTAGPILARVAGGDSRVAFIPNPVDASIDVHRCHERSDQAHDVFFAAHMASRLDPEDLRERAPALIREHLPQAHCGFYGHSGQPSLFGADFMRALGDARIGLNFSQRVVTATPGQGGALYLYSSDRIGLYMGNGLLVFVAGQSSLSELYGETVVEVNGPDDFVDKLRYYLDRDDERRRVAAAGYQLAHREFNERLVAQYMLERVLGLPLSHDYLWPTDNFGA